MFDNKILVITGGTGSFGNEMLRYFINHTNIGEVRVFSRDEEKQAHMRLKLKDTRIKYWIGDIRNFESVNDAFKGADYVFHAAALKQVPSCEFYPMEAVQTNILGANNIINAAISNNVKKVILLSTDKAVEPGNTMGMTKAIMEKLMVAKARSIPSSETKLCATRYGNVIASRGSVIPLFIEQAKSGSPLTVTDPSMTRFLMTLQEAVELVLFAFEKGNSGDILVQKAHSCTIGDLAQAIKEIFNSNSEIQIIGARHGEKQHEALFSIEESSTAVDLGNFYRISMDNRDLNYNDIGNLNMKELSDKHILNTSHHRLLSIEQIKEKLLGLEYIQNELNKK